MNDNFEPLDERENSEGREGSDNQNGGEQMDQDESLARQFFHTMALMHRYHHISRRDREHRGDPHRGQGRVLALLKLKPEITQKELTYLLNMRNQSLGELLVKLERSGFIERTPSESDRRVMNVKLTEAGLEAANRAEEQQQDNDRLFDFFTDEEQAELGGYLKRLIEELEKKLAEQGFTGRDPRAFWAQGGEQGPPFGPGGRGRFGPGRGFGPGGGGAKFRFDDERGGRGGHGCDPFRGFRGFGFGESNRGSGRD
ncbi:MarR family transcriptional regulator [Saccharibacillus sp. CPCC 101409]|uniref:MarR family winged helix-turn-helix transcriptional regulator n=1 Tax=Saccharibacillus sp. CPCC 101409 TaxID=3058041 RepID=UPI0026713028|nr:MarR family transcriptional regulator [Saccharibacillus sp. CPCC 101409]MDO3412158.1 MarR family transcriptional regulator [Saccharibacillus sp. CPCC 101409]